MKRLLCILSSLDAGGAETFMMKIFRNLPEEYKLDFIVSAETGFYEKEVIELGGRIHRVPLRTKHPIATFKAIYDVVKNNNYTHILKLCDTPIGLYDLLAAKLGGAKVLCVRSCNSNASNSKLGRYIHDILRPFFSYFTDIKIAPSSLAAAFTFGKSEVKNVHLIHNGVDLSVYRYSANARNKVRREFNIAENRLVVGHIGRFTYQKNHIFLIKIFAELLKKEPEAVLMLVGKGEKRTEIEKQITDLGIEQSVIFTGIRSDIPDLLSAMDVFVFPSFYEGMPNTVIEAQATGLPCLIADTITEEAGITECVHYKSLTDSAEAWADKVLSLSKINENRDTYTENMKKYGYDITECVNLFLKIIKIDEVR